MTAVKVCINMTPDAVILVMLYLKTIEICRDKIIRGEVPGDRADEELLNCILNELETAFTARP